MAELQKQLDVIRQTLPPELLELEQWVCWKYERDPQRSEKPRKTPKSPHTGGNAQSNNPDTWGTFEQAAAAAIRRGFTGVGFMFHGQHLGIDIDHCRDAETGEINEIARDIIARMGSYAEVSPSGTGIHILCSGMLPNGGKGRRKGEVEVYGIGRYFTVTGKAVGDTGVLGDGSEAVKAVIADYIGAKPATAGGSQHLQQVTQPLADATQHIQRAVQPLADDALLSIARHSKDGDRFARLWSGDHAGYSSASEADLALCNKLCFYTGGDPVRIDALFRQSGLFRPEKWDAMRGTQTYGEMTINCAIDSAIAFYSPTHETQRADAVMDESSPFARYARVYALVGGYCADRGSLRMESKDHNGEIVTKPLANFVALITDEVTRDDGAEARREFRVEGITESGKPLPGVYVPTGRFGTMGWPLEAWGADANLYPGTTVKDKVRHAVQAASLPLMARETIYTHSGWRRIGNNWAYLYHGGAIGAEGVSVELSGKLAGYSLPPETGDTLEAVRASIRMLDVLPFSVAVPLLAHMYLAPLCDPLQRKSGMPAFVLYLAGATGSGKSTAAALALSHFGRGWKPKNLPASFSDTANNVQQKAFELKDMPLLVDDFAPNMNPLEAKRRAGDAQKLLRAWGDNAERGRMNADGTLRAAKPPRGLGMMTGEMLPDVGESGVARLFTVDVKAGDIDKGEALTACQEQAEAGLPAQAMRGYIEWLLPQMDVLPDVLGAMFAGYREQAQRYLGGTHGRQPEAVAWLLIGFDMALHYWKDVGTIQETRTLLERAKGVLLAHSMAQRSVLTEEEPVNLFLTALTELNATGQARIQDIERGGASYTDEHTVGFQDREYVYLLPGAAFGKVQGHLRAQGTVFPITKAELLKRLEGRGMLEVRGGNRTCTKHIPGVDKGSQRCAWLRRAALISYAWQADAGEFEVVPDLHEEELLAQ